jgi:hypothetical protein
MSHHLGRIIHEILPKDVIVFVRAVVQFCNNNLRVS